MKFNRLALTIATGALSIGLATHASALTININAGAGLSANAAALAAFQSAAQTWAAIFSDPVTIEIAADLTNSGSSTVIGSTDSKLLEIGYTNMRSAMVGDAANESSNAIVSSLPTLAQFTAQLPTGFDLNGQVIATKANLKALGFSAATLDLLAGTTTDATINFNSGFAFDYDSSDGVDGNKKDFETVALHEIGHVLGFISAVDIIDGLTPGSPTNPLLVPVSALDLFRINPANQPLNANGFGAATRELRPCQAASFTDVTVAYAMSTAGTAGQTGCDGNQASHWKADELTGTHIGLFDPTLANGATAIITAADIRALDLIGWDYIVSQVPTASTLAMFAMGLGALSVAATRRRTEKRL